MPINPRISVTLEQDIYDWIIGKAKEEERTPANLAAAMLSRAVREKIRKDSSIQQDEKQAS